MRAIWSGLRSYQMRHAQTGQIWSDRWGWLAPNSNNGDRYPHPRACLWSPEHATWEMTHIKWFQIGWITG